MPTVTLGVGVAVVAAVSLGPLYAPRLRLRRSTGLGSCLVVAAVGLISASALVGRLRWEPALYAFLLLLVGSLLLLAEGGEDDDPPRRLDEPPWWPEFEDAFRRYSSRPRRPVVTR